MTYQERQRKLGLFRFKRRLRRKSYRCLQLSCVAKMMSESSQEAYSKMARGIKYNFQRKFQLDIKDSIYLFLPQEWPNMGTGCPEMLGT